MTTTYETQITSQHPGFSVNIVEIGTHRQSVYSKFGFRTRRQAIAVAAAALIALRNGMDPRDAQLDWVK